MLKNIFSSGHFESYLFKVLRVIHPQPSRLGLIQLLFFLSHTTCTQIDIQY
jgi:hypothetical protein